MVLGVYGAGGLGREVYELALDIQDGTGTSKWEQIVFIADYADKGDICGVPVITFEVFQEQFSKENSEIVIAVGEPQARAKLRNKVESYGYSLATLVHPSARVSRWAKLGKGCVVTYGCYISFSGQLGDNALLQPSCGVGHDVIIEEDCVVSACVRIAGKTTVGKRTYIGMQTVIRENVAIGKDVIIGMGSSVHRDIEAGMVALGNPARPIQRSEGQGVFHRGSDQSCT